MTVWIQNPFDNFPDEGFRKMRYAHMADAFVRAEHNAPCHKTDDGSRKRSHP